ncbi:hypothetical protein HK098_008351 [Nowakowskiella sp. JEL0407]|nr:hypothetical protein HK098_008351 [Nowakowskiella sp. JEL0407]
MKLVNEIIQQAKHAFHEWKILSPIERRDSLLAISEIMLKNKASLVDAELSGGKTLSDSQTDVEMSAEIFRYFAGFCERIHGRTYSTHSRFTSYTIRQPIGVVGLITSYNYPLLLASWKTAPALASGNTVVLKPAHQTPESSLLLSKLLEPALPPNVFNVIPGDAAVGSQIVSHPLISKISFTGSYSTAKLISEKSLTRNVYELGGNNAAIICADTKDLEEAVETILSAAFGNGGQNCCACSKLFVEEEIYQQVLILVRERLRRFKIGDWRTMETEIGPVIDKVQYEKVANFIGEWHARGLNRMQAELPKGLPSDLYIPPTVFYDVEDAGFPAHEVFGPVLSIIKPFKSFRKVIDDVNNSGYGLVAGVFTSDISRMEYAVKNLEVGMVWVNTYNDTPTYLPFGGVKQSGNSTNLIRVLEII